jgi:MGT family glycosyltransferase
VIAATRALYQSGLPALNTARAEVGLAPLLDLFGQLDAAGRVLIATSRAFDFEPCLPRSFRYVGPYLADPTWTEDWTPPWGKHPDRPIVLVSFSTMYQGQERALASVIAALGELDVLGLVTLGPTLKTADFPAPANVTVTQSAPHSRILPLASAVVTHAGHASTLRPLMAGAPLVMLPIGRDQPDNAVRVAMRGAGLRIGPDSPPAEISAAIQRVLADPSFRTSARSLGAKIAADAQERSAEDVLIAFAREAP